MTVLLAMIFAPIINAFVFVKLWAWFIVPTFHQNPLRLVEAIGIMFLINFIKTKRSKDSDNEDFWKEFGKNIGFIILTAAFALLSGWIVKAFL